jgi:cold shock protein
MIGTVRWFNLQKGYGFIRPDDGSPNIFVHMSAVESAGMSDLKEGRRVIFEIQRDERTGNASAVSLKPFVFETTPRLDDRFATTNPFDIISAFISSTWSTRLRSWKAQRAPESGAGERPSWIERDAQRWNAISLFRDADWPPRAVTMRALDLDGRKVHCAIKGDTQS